MVVRAGVGVLVANQSLVLQRVRREAAGAYQCAARNSLGEGASDSLVLDVKCMLYFTSVVFISLS